MRALGLYSGMNSGSLEGHLEGLERCMQWDLGHAAGVTWGFLGGSLWVSGAHTFEYLWGTRGLTL